MLIICQKVDAQNFKTLAIVRPPSPLVGRYKHHLGVQDHKILARLKAHLTKEEDDMIMRLVECSREQQIPPAFINENKKMLAKTCLLHKNEGVLWEGKIMRKNSNFFICEGDWPQFVVYHKLKPEDILLFLLVDKSTFLVMPYTKKMVEAFTGCNL
ncbi:uncharacterized protein LOC132037379 [Lycium ferocissimum]|uniref:uncharacterized protein LOC132037379 n=1 Tax=Lycium ferocissimum TaxID=112874 RepID=UPI002814EE8A|nr:uncharacterized protein LOC132037379 [Lycium ferocissimum]